MLIFDENLRIQTFDNIYDATNIEYFHVLDLILNDFTLAPIYALEELVCDGLKIQINNKEFILPIAYYILIYSKETSDLDCISIEDLPKNGLPLVVFDDYKHIELDIKIVDYIPQTTFVTPFLNKHQSLSFPIGEKTWINISGYDQYGYLKHNTIHEFIA